MIKKIIALSIGSLCFCFQGFAQNPDGNFGNLKFDFVTKGSGASDYNGWGLNNNDKLDVRPNPNGGAALIINNHNGLTFSAHSTYGGIRFYNQGYPIGPLEPTGGATMVMSIANGKVGVGTVNPRVLLDVGADVSNGKLGAVFGRLPEGDQIGDGTFLGVRGYVTNATAAKSFALEHSFYGVTNSSVNFLRGQSSEDGFLSFNTGKNVERLRIDAAGNVGIGTTTPTAKLSVNGNLWATEIKVATTNPWPDYVFEPLHEKLSLADLEIFIKKNKHLPEIPTAKTIDKEGINLGDMNAKLLKKVEELTLYLIELKKNNDVLNERVKKLENKN
ncbi:hypothetical protein HDF26_003807 [Pedobacter cryoconitis]|uniref:hypothetical protein n=1 Tax=Pedobacter cryoconitis TaxID=188932 RepID=UPI001619DF75|nr:hypothetical protein [Pedobacter cryoconitis]MBB6273347.1 hypothetical protein [Pedobacter cryoconitis]